LGGTSPIRLSECLEHIYENVHTIIEKDGGKVGLIHTNRKQPIDYRSTSNMLSETKKRPSGLVSIKTAPKPTKKSVQIVAPLPNCSDSNEDTLVYEMYEDHAECTIYENVREPDQPGPIGASSNNKKKLKSKPETAKKPSLRSNVYTVPHLM